MNADLRARIDEYKDRNFANWLSTEDRFSHVPIVKELAPEEAGPAPEEKPKRNIVPDFAPMAPARVGLQTGKKPALAIAARVPGNRVGRPAVEPRDPATCTHFQGGKDTWHKNGKGKRGQQKVICRACKRESELIDGAIIDPGPYVPRIQPNPPANMDQFLIGMAETAGLTLDDIIGHSRLQKIVNVRREICHVLSTVHRMPNRAIGHAINKDKDAVQYLLGTRKL